MPDYTKLAAMAERLIEENGRAISLLKFTTTPPDATKPWRAPTARTDADEVDAIGVFVPLASKSFLGIEEPLSQDVPRGEQICLVSASVSTDDLRTYNEIEDSDGTRWKIIRPQLLQPGTVKIIYAFEVQR